MDHNRESCDAMSKVVKEALLLMGVICHPLYLFILTFSVLFKLIFHLFELKFVLVFKCFLIIVSRFWEQLL